MFSHFSNYDNWFRYILLWSTNQWLKIATCSYYTSIYITRYNSYIGTKSLHIQGGVMYIHTVGGCATMVKVLASKSKLNCWLISLSNLFCWRFQTIKGTNNPQYFFLFCFTIPPGTCKEAEASRAGSHYLYKLNDPNTEKIPAQWWLEPHATCSLDTCHGNHTLTSQNIKKSAYNLICIYT